MQPSKSLFYFFIGLGVLFGLLSSGCVPEIEPDVAASTYAARVTHSDPAAQPVRVRRNAKTLTRKERKQYVKAVRKLKKVPSPYTPGLSYYDQLVVWHQSMYVCDPGMPMSAMPMGHGGPLFLPWHRLYLLLFENALREVSGNRDITVPYWDWTDPDSTAAVFQDDFMGGDGDPDEGYAVTTGPFRKGQWTVSIQPQPASEQFSRWPHLVRRFGSLPNSPLPTAADIERALAVEHYDVAPYDSTSNPGLSFRNHIEGYRDQPGNPSIICAEDGFMAILPLNPPTMHNAVHAWVGGLIDITPDGKPRFGTMVVSTSPNDPAFFLHHSNLDRIWAEWQSRHGVRTYQPVSGAPGNNVDDMLMPFHHIGIMATPGDMEDIAELGYRYE